MRRNTVFANIAVLLIVCWIPAQLATQEHAAHGVRHHHYKLIDLGTFGGPTSRNDGIYPPLNNHGIVIGGADTSAPDPFYPNFNPLILPGGASDPYIFRAFESNGERNVTLDSLPGGYSTWPTSISENGLIAGSAINGALDPITGWPEETAVFWHKGKITNLGTLGGYESGAGMVNSRGEVTGFSGNAIPDPYSLFGLGTQTRAFLWDKKKGMQDIGTLGGPDAASPFINEHGQIAGFSYTLEMAVDPFLWEPPTQRHPNSRMIDLGSLGGTFGAEGDGVALNNRGQVVGASNLAGDIYSHPFLWTRPGPMRDLGTLGGPTGVANAINDAGEVVGYADTATSTDAFLWRKGKMTDLGTLAGHCFSGAGAINAETQVGGASFPCDNSLPHAFLWEKGGPMVDLNDLVSGADMTLTGSFINDRGEITGLGVLANSDLHAFLLIPCDENHPGIEGCDYSMVDAGPTASVQQTVLATSGSTLPTALWQRRNHLLTLAVMSPSETTVTVSPTSLVFSTQALGTASAGKIVTLENTGSTTLTISNIEIIGTNAGDFLISATTCGTSLPAGASCTVKVKFKPTKPGTRSAVLSFTDNGVGSPQEVTLSGVGTTAKLYPAHMNFGSVTIGTTSSPATVTLTNVGMSTLTITGIAIRGTDVGDFAQTNDCGTSLAAGASCSISVTFKPTLAGTRKAALKVSDNGGGSPQSVSLRGYGVGSCKRFGYTCDPNIPHQCCSGLQCVFTGGPFYVYRCE